MAQDCQDVREGFLSASLHYVQQFTSSPFAKLQGRQPLDSEHGILSSAGQGQHAKRLMAAASPSARTWDIGMQATSLADATVRQASVSPVTFELPTAMLTTACSWKR